MVDLDGESRALWFASHVYTTDNRVGDIIRVLTIRLDISRFVAALNMAIAFFFLLLLSRVVIKRCHNAWVLTS